MSTTWYAKLDCDFHDNPKAIEAGLLGRAVYVLVLCINAKKGAPGVISSDDIKPWYIARELQVSEADAKRGIEKAVAADLIEVNDGLVTICGWTEDYAKYPMSSPEKQQRYRDRVKSKRKATNTNVTCVTEHGNGGGNALPPVTQVGRKEGREGDSAPYDPTDPGHVGNLARQTWTRLSEIRVALAAEFGIAGVLPLTPITPASANQRGFRDLSARIHDEGNGAPAVCIRVLEVLTSQAREKRSIEWLSEKAFGENAWRFAREQVPKWRDAPKAERHEQEQEFRLDEVSA